MVNRKKNIRISHLSWHYLIQNLPILYYYLHLIKYFLVLNHDAILDKYVDIQLRILFVGINVWLHFPITIILNILLLCLIINLLDLCKLSRIIHHLKHIPLSLLFHSESRLLHKGGLYLDDENIYWIVFLFWLSLLILYFLLLIFVKFLLKFFGRFFHGYQLYV